MGTYIVSDIHGYYNEFMRLLRQIDFDKTKDYITILGDLIDRGPDSDKMIDWILDNYDGDHVDMILGNHEDRYIKYFENRVTELAGKHICRLDRLYDSLSEDTKVRFYKLCKSLKIVKHVFINKKRYLLVHAGVRWKRPCDTDRDFATQAREVFYLGKDVRGYSVIFGHTPIQKLYRNIPDKKIRNIKITQLGRKYCIDCGVYLEGGKLACLRLEDMKEIYIEKEQIIALGDSSEIVKKVV